MLDLNKPKNIIHSKFFIMKKIFLLLFLMTISLGQSQNMISNSYFTSNTNGWTLSSPGVRSGGEVVFSPTATAGNAWDNELKWTGLSLTNAATYTLTFRARAASNRNISVNLQNTGIWNDQFRNNAVALTTTMTVYTYTFNATSTNSNVQLNFHMAGYGTTAGVYIDDVTLVAGTATQCTNFIQDGTETGIDCGGSCGVCKLDPGLSFSPTTVSKFVGDAAFTQTPTTSSPAAITYSSGTPGVATVNSTSGLVTIVGAGSTIITATQVADATYNGATATYTLTVSFPPPASAAPTPPARNTWDVVSLYSGAYTPTSGASWQAGSDVAISGDNARFFNGFTLARLAFAPVNLTTAGMTNLHIDVYTQNQNQLWFELQGNRKVVSSIALNGWVSFDIPLTDYVGLNLANISFFDLNNPTGAALPNKIVYLDNIYFWRTATSPAPTFNAFTVPAKLVGDAPFTVAATSNSSGAFTYTSSNTAVATVSGNTITVVGIGSTTITASQAASAPYSAGSTTATLNVSAPAPTVAAPTPPARNTWDVVSVYSAAYTPVAGTRNYNPNWGQTGFANFAQPTIGGDQVIKYSGVNYQGTDIGSTINATTTGMTYVHIDIWTTNCPTTDFRIIDGADRSKILTTPGGQWNSFDIPLTDFVSLNKTNIIQFKYQRSPYNAATDSNEWYIDNIYFWRDATTPPPTLGALTVPAKLTNSAPFTLTAPTSNTSGAWSYSSSNTAVATISGNTVTIKGAGTSIITATQAAADGYSSGSVTANLVVTFPLPTVAAPTPTVPSGNVISIFSNAYTNQAGTDFFPNWGQQTVVSDLTIAGNATKKYTNFNYEGTQFTTINAVSSNLYSIHFDMLSPNVTSVKISLISNTGGGEKAVIVPITPLNSWKGIDLLLSQFSSQGLNLTGLFQIKLENWTSGGPSWSTGGELYIDNIYFSNVVTNVAPIISGFTIPIKLVGDAPFNLTTPTSTSAGAFTYTSSNTAVATVSGNTVTVLAAGTSVITATQAANGSYTSGSITASLLVSGGPTLAAPTPTIFEPQTKSVFSNTYPNISATTYDNYGGPASSATVAIKFNSTMKISSMGRLGINLVGGVDVSNMKTLHLDVFTPNITKFNLILFNYSAGNPQTLFPITTTLNGWNSINITLTGQTKVNQILLVASPDTINTIASTTTTGVAYVDNIYFWTDVPRISALSSQFRGKTISDLNSSLSSVAVSGATTYRYEITNKTSNAVSIININGTNFNLTQIQTLPATNPQTIAYGTTYAVRVAVNNGGYVYGSSYNVITPANIRSTKIVNKQCGVTLAKLDESIYADQVYNSNKFRFIVNGGSISNQEIDSKFPYFNLTQLAGTISYNTSYTIRVKASKDDGATWPTSYGATCTVSTPVSVPTSRIISPSCGSTLPSIGTFLFAEQVYGANLYRFEVNGGVFVSRNYINPKSELRLTNLVGGVEYNTSYTVKVAISLDNGATWEAYGRTCTVTTPAAPISRKSNQEINTNLFEVNAFPNPFATNFRLNIESSNDDVIEMKVYDMIGRQLEAKNATVSELSDLEIGINYPSGIYNILLKQGENVKSIRMIKR